MTRRLVARIHRSDGNLADLAGLRRGSERSASSSLPTAPRGRKHTVWAGPVCPEWRREIETSRALVRAPGSVWEASLASGCLLPAPRCGGDRGQQSTERRYRSGADALGRISSPAVWFRPTEPASGPRQRRSPKVYPAASGNLRSKNLRARGTTFMHRFNRLLRIYRTTARTRAELGKTETRQRQVHLRTEQRARGRGVSQGWAHHEPSNGCKREGAPPPNGFGSGLRLAR
jgi:hypothetical protein